MQSMYDCILPPQPACWRTNIAVTLCANLPPKLKYLKKNTAVVLKHIAF
jgi:hypothetical protein